MVGSSLLATGDLFGLDARDPSRIACSIGLPGHRPWLRFLRAVSQGCESSHDPQVPLRRAARWIRYAGDPRKLCAMLPDRCAGLCSDLRAKALAVRAGDRTRPPPPRKTSQDANNAGIGFSAIGKLDATRSASAHPTGLDPV